MYCRTVVGGYTPKKVLAEQLALAREAKIAPPDLRLLLLAEVLKFDEPADIGRNLSGIVNSRKIQSDVVIWFETRRRPTGLGRRRMCERRLHGKRQRQSMILAVIGNIAVELEIAPLRGQLWAKRADMTGSTRLAGLDREGWEGKRPPRSDSAEYQQQDQNTGSAGYNDQRPPAIGTSSDCRKGVTRRRFILRHQGRKPLQKPAFRESIKLKLTNQGWLPNG